MEMDKEKLQELEHIEEKIENADKITKLSMEMDLDPEYRNPIPYDRELYLEVLQRMMEETNADRYKLILSGLTLKDKKLFVSSVGTKIYKKKDGSIKIKYINGLLWRAETLLRSNKVSLLTRIKYILQITFTGLGRRVHNEDLNRLFWERTHDVLLTNCVNKDEE